MNISLGRPTIKMTDKRSNLVPSLPLSYQNRNKRVTQRVVTVQPLELSPFDQLLEEPIRSIAPALPD